ncbi:amino acid ABC transporter ATP-binding/permease protein [Celerinatantimonas sp. YJH-8]|uniref:amino acid ABC transporter ATP-binding/permease protein n=1 Tax=Celerinatantimonas sp. YJH-8 TaxID=3228714 RepID=UPI0038C21707
MKYNHKLTIRTLTHTESGMLWLALLLGLIASLSAVFLLAVSGWFITAAGLAGVAGAILSFNYFTPGAIIRLMAILRTSGRYFEQLTAHHHLLSLLKELRLWVWNQLSRHALPQSLKIGDLLQRIVSDVDLLNRWPLQVWMPRIYAWVACIVYLIVIQIFVPVALLPMASGLIVNCVVLPWLSYRLGKKLIWQLQLIGIYRRSRFINLFGALITLSIRGRWQNYAQRLFHFDKRQFSIEYRMQVIAAATRHMMLAITAMTIASSCILAAPQLEAGTVNGSVFAGLLFALLGLNEVLSPLAMSFIGTAQAQVGVKRLNQMRPKHPIETPEPNRELAPIQSITLDQIDVRKTGAVNGITDLTVVFESAKPVWLKGPSGIGKSTLLDTLANQLQPQQGHIHYNGEPLSLEQRLHYQSKIGYLPQRPYIFNQTIAANLRLANEQASEQQLQDVLTAVGLWNWVQHLPQQLDTLLGAQGNNISGGQARRLGLARVLLQDTDVLLLDEPFEGLDQQSISTVSTALATHYTAPILVIASHLEVPLFSDYTVLELQAKP